MSNLNKVQPGKKIAILADFPLHFLPSSSYPLPLGHYATWLPQLAQALEGETKLQIHWITLDSFVETEKEHTVWNQKFHVLPTWRRGRAATLFWADRRRIQRKIRQIDPDLVHGWGNENIWGWATVAAGLPNIFSVQGLLGVYGKLGHQHLRDRLMARIEATVLRKAQLITTESRWAKGEIEKQTGRTDVQLVEYGVADGFFKTEPCPDLNHPYAVMVGTADYRKGVDLAIRIFSSPKLRNYSLKVIGGISPFAKRCKKMSPPNVEWLGRKTQEEIISLLAQSRCLILPTRADVCANVVKEARVVGLPVVASPHGGHIQYVQNGKNGFICPLDSSQDWEASLCQLFQNPEKALAMGGIMREEHRRLLSPEKTAGAFLALYQKVLSGGGRQGEP